MDAEWASSTLKAARTSTDIGSSGHGLLSPTIER